MHEFPIAKIVRVKHAYIENVWPGMSERELKRSLADKGFALENTYDDGFYETYSCTDYKNTNKNTIVQMDKQGHIHAVILSMVEPDPLPGT